MPEIDDANFQYFASVRSIKPVHFHKMVFAGKTGFTELFSGSYYDAKQQKLLHLRFTSKIRQRTKNKTQNLAKRHL